MQETGNFVESIQILTDFQIRNFRVNKTRVKRYENIGYLPGLLKVFLCTHSEYLNAAPAKRLINRIKSNQAKPNDVYSHIYGDK